MVRGDSTGLGTPEEDEDRVYCYVVDEMAKSARDFVFQRASWAS